MDRSKLLLPAIMCILVSCEKLTLCYEADDFGSSGEFDILSVSAAESNCFYEKTQSFEENNNLNIKNCLSSTNLGEDIRKIDAALEKDFTKISKVDGVDIDQNSCKKLDPINQNIEITPVSGTEQSTAQLAAKSIFDHCLDSCQDTCGTNITPDSAIWVKAHLRGGGSNYIGIDLKKDVFLTVTTMGSVSLDRSSNSTNLTYSKYGMQDINYNFITKDGMSLDLSLDINKNNMSLEDLATTEVSPLANLISRTYFSFTPTKSDLVVNPLSESPSSAYKFQKPNFTFFNCNYTAKNANGVNGVNCTFDHTTCGIQCDNHTSRLNSYFNTNYSKIAVFFGDFYNYASTSMNELRFTAGMLISNNNTLIVSSDGDNSITQNDTIVGYFWNNLNEEFSFEITKPMKIAVKHLGSNSSTTNCQYTITDTASYSINSINEEAKTSEVIYNFTYPVVKETEGEKWQTLKQIGEGGIPTQEIVFNRFSSTGSDKRSRITLRKATNAAICSKGLLIKLLPIKEYKVPTGGFLFFSIPHVIVPDSQKIIYYTIVNRQILNDLEGVTPYQRVNEFFEFEEDKQNFTMHYVNLLTPDDVKLLDTSGPNDILTNAIPVRQNQLVRLDYSNWFLLDNQKNIQMKTITVSGDLESIDVDQGIGLSAFVWENPLYFCFGSQKEAEDVDKSCVAGGGKVESIKTDTTGTIANVCALKANQCRAESDMVKKLNDVDFTNANCIRTSISCDTLPTTAQQSECRNNSDITYEDDDLGQFWAKLYAAYTRLQNSTYFKNCYNNLVNEVYTKARVCYSFLNNNDDYYLYEGFNDSSGQETHRGIRSSSSSYSDVTSLDQKIEALSNFFKTISYTDNGGITNYKSLFYYYKKICNIDAKGQCLISIPQCYSADNYAGRFSSLLERLKNNFNNTNLTLSAIETNGTLTDLDINLGAYKIQPFNGIMGLIKNFPEVVGNSSAYYKHIRYEKLIQTKGNNFLTFFIIKNIPIDNITNIQDYYRVGSVASSEIIKMTVDASSIYKNGERLALFLGEDQNGYSGVPGSIRYKDESNGNSGNVSVSNNSNNTGSNILELVKYTSSSGGGSQLDTSSKFMFNEKGMLVSRITGATGIDFSDPNFPEGNQYIESNSGSSKTLFFKVVDTNNNLADNSGNYEIKVKTHNKSESFVITVFRNLFNTVLSYVDGSQVSLRQRNGSKILCGTSSNSNEIKEKCVFFDEVDVHQNGNSCSYKEDDSTNNAHCFVSCETVDPNVSSSCEHYSDGRGFVKGIFEQFLNDPLYQLVAKLSLVLMIILYGFGYFFGLSNFTQSEIVPKLLRVCFIYFLLGPSGWNFFNNYVIKFFKDGVDSILFLVAGSFETSLDSELSLALANGNYSDKSVLFSTCFNNMELLFSNQVFSKIFGLAFSSWFGLVYLYLILATVINYVVGIISAITLYLTTQLYMSLVFCFFPLVILFMFFERTKKTFDNWLNLLAGFAGQQLFLVMTLSFFNILIHNFIKSTFSYPVCWLNIFSINVAGIPLGAISFWKIPTSSLSGGLNSIDENVPSFYNIMSFYMVGVLMSKFVSGATEMGQNIFGAENGIDVGKGVAGSINSVVHQGADGLNKFMRNTGTTFGQGMAKRLTGAKSIEDYRKKQEGEVQERRAKRNQHFESVEKGTKNKMDTYRKSTEFQKNLNNKLEQDSGYKKLSGSQKEKQKEKISSQLLSDKEKEYRQEASNESIKQLFGEEIRKNCAENGVEFNKGNEDQYAEQYAESHGLS
jgi:type IV secretory pathway VirB6-like protein